MKKTALYYFSAFFSGLSVMTAELLGARLLAPYFGNSMFVWTNMIGLVMLALSVGYFLGGRWADKRADAQQYFSILFFAGLWILLIPYFAQVVMPLTFSFGNLSVAVILGSFITVLLIFVLPLLMLGMIVPYTLKLVAKNMKSVGQSSGLVSMHSTFGSLLGTFLPAFVLIPLLGVSRSFWLCGILLMLLGVFQLKKAWMWVLTMAAALLVLFPASFFDTENVVFSQESPYGHVFVQEWEGEMLLFVDNQYGIQSIYDPETSITEEYYAYFSILPAMHSEAKRVLILGHAGGSFTRVFNEYFPELEVTGVEINPAVTAAAEATMNLTDLSVDIHHADARSFLLSTNEKWDFILIDAYKGSTIPAHLATAEFFQLAKSRLSDEGILGINVAAKESDFSQILSNTLGQQFEYGWEVPIPNSYNTMVLVSEAMLELGDILHDDLQGIGEYVAENTFPLSTDENTPVFTDDKSTLVELENARMLVDLYSTL